MNPYFCLSLGFGSVSIQLYSMPSFSLSILGVIFLQKNFWKWSDQLVEESFAMTSSVLLKRCFVWRETTTAVRMPKQFRFHTIIDSFSIIGSVFWFPLTLFRRENQNDSLLTLRDWIPISSPKWKFSNVSTIDQILIIFHVFVPRFCQTKPIVSLNIWKSSIYEWYWLFRQLRFNLGFLSKKIALKTISICLTIKILALFSINLDLSISLSSGVEINSMKEICFNA